MSSSTAVVENSSGDKNKRTAHDPAGDSKVSVRSQPQLRWYGFPVADYQGNIKFKDYDKNDVSGESGKLLLGKNIEHALINLHSGGDAKIADIIRKLYKDGQAARKKFGDHSDPGTDHVGVNYSIFDVDQPQGSTDSVAANASPTVYRSPNLHREFANLDKNSMFLNTATKWDVLWEEIKHLFTAGPWRRELLNKNTDPGKTDIDKRKTFIDWYNDYGKYAKSTQSIFPNMPSRDLASWLSRNIKSNKILAIIPAHIRKRFEDGLLSYYNDAAEYTALANNVKYWLAEGGVYAPRMTFTGKPDDSTDVITQLLRNRIIELSKSDKQYRINRANLESFQRNKKFKSNLDFTGKNMNLQKFIDLINYRQKLKYKNNKTPEEIKSLKHAEQALTNGYDMASSRTQKTAPAGGLRSWYNSTYTGTGTAIV